VLRVALTGGIACGKSVVARILHDKGCFIHSADKAAHDLMFPGGAAWNKIAARFGPEILAPEGSIDRGRLGRIVFSDPEALKFLNKLIHPLVLAEMKKLASRLELEGRTLIFISEAALTVEAGCARLFDKVVVVHCPSRVQAARLMIRDGITGAEAQKKIVSQMPVGEKLKHADYAVDASGSLQETIDQTERLYAQLVRDAELKMLAKKR
jgi:dephospho-CoA kinase